MANETNIRVVLRIRPLNAVERKHRHQSVLQQLDKTTLVFDPDMEDEDFYFHGEKQKYWNQRRHKNLTFSYDGIYNEHNSNWDIYHECTKPLVDSVLKGYNCSVFAYGATGAGKTYTMLGNSNTYGVIYLTMQQLFEKISGDSEERNYDVLASYLEIYNERIMNLFKKTGPLRLRENAAGLTIADLDIRSVKSADELLELLLLGNANRTQHPTDANAESSRSHAIFQVHIRITDRKSNTKRTVKFSLIDLAGSERATSTKGFGARFVEGARINRSLLALANCINKLADGHPHIPYRDSNMTRILKDSLGGTCRTLMIANVSMSWLSFEDTYNTLKYASRARCIRQKCEQNTLKLNMPKELYARKMEELLKENERLKSLNRELVEKAKLGMCEKDGKSAAMNLSAELNMWYNRINSVYDTLSKATEQMTLVQSKNNLLQLYNKFRNDELMIQEVFGVVQQRTIEAELTLTEEDKANLQEWEKQTNKARVSEEKLKKDIKASPLHEFLSAYCSAKAQELQYAKRHLLLEHISRIYSYQLFKGSKLKKSLIYAANALRDFTDVPNTNQGADGDKPDNNAQQILQHIYRLSQTDERLLLDGLREPKGAKISSKDLECFRRLCQQFMNFDENMRTHVIETVQPSGSIRKSLNKLPNLSKIRMTAPQTPGKMQRQRTFTIEKGGSKSDTSIGEIKPAAKRINALKKLYNPRNVKKDVRSVVTPTVSKSPYAVVLAPKPAVPKNANQNKSKEEPVVRLNRTAVMRAKKL